MAGEQRVLFDAWSADLVKHPALWPPADDSVLSSDEAAELVWPGAARNEWTGFEAASVGDEWAAHRASVQGESDWVSDWVVEGPEGVSG